MRAVLATLEGVVRKRLGIGDPLIRAVRSDGLTYLDEAALADLADVVQKAPPGLLIEAGCALGGSAIIMASAKGPDRRLDVYDVFGMIPAPSSQDGADVHARYDTIRTGRAKGLHGRRYYGYEEDLLGVVRDNFGRYGFPVERSGVRLIQGRFEDTMTGDEPVAVAHIDADWYDSVMTCLTRLTYRLVPGGTLVIDDYEHWSGCRQAVDEYFRGRDGFDFVRRSRLHIVRQ
jgi:asparagine synthase (glutamine-hydrolysing)